MHSGKRFVYFLRSEKDGRRWLTELRSDMRQVLLGVVLLLTQTSIGDALVQAELGIRVS